MSAPDLIADARVILHMLRGQRREGSHAERLESFYAPQAQHYDRFRERLLQGRRDLIRLLAPPPRARIVELGCGTASNLTFLAEDLARIGRLDLVDLCPSLLALARLRSRPFGNVRVVQSDAVTYNPGEQVDCVYFSYALTMIPDWESALQNASNMLRPGGKLGIVDFHLPLGGGVANTFWQHWFAHDGVRLSSAHIPRLQEMFPAHFLQERRAPVPYLPGARVPYYLFMGWKP